MIRLALLLVSISIPVSVFAVTTPSTFTDLIYFVLGYIALLIPVVITLSFAVFFWGLVKFISRVGGNEEEIKNGKNLMIYGIIGLFVMASLWAIVGFISGEFNFGSLFIPQLPEGAIRGVDTVPSGGFPSA